MKSPSYLEYYVEKYYSFIVYLFVHIKFYRAVNHSLFLLLKASWVQFFYGIISSVFSFPFLSLTWLFQTSVTPVPTFMNFLMMPASNSKWAFTFPKTETSQSSHLKCCLWNIFQVNVGFEWSEGRERLQMESKGHTNYSQWQEKWSVLYQTAWFPQISDLSIMSVWDLMKAKDWDSLGLYNNSEPFKRQCYFVKPDTDMI